MQNGDKVCRTAGWTRRVQVRGKDRKTALDRFKKVLQKWRLKMPATEPLLLDFGLKDFYKTGLIECWIANENREGYCGKFLYVFPGQTCPYHHHNFKHETFFVVKGSVEMKAGSRKRIMKEGDVLVMGQGTGHSFTGRERDGALLLEVSRPCRPGDSIFENRRIGRNGII